jgi:hypothetical protein
MKNAAVVTLALLVPALIWAVEAPATLEVVSDEGWCIIYIDGDTAGDKTTIKKIAPGEHFVRITDAFDNEWFDDVVTFPSGITLRSKAEPSGFTIINLPEDPPIEEPPPGEEPPEEGDVPGDGKTRVRISHTSFYDLRVRALVYVNSDTPGEAVTVDGVQVGVTPVILKDVKPGKHVVSIGDRAEAEIEAKSSSLTEVEVSSKP